MPKYRIGHTALTWDVFAHPENIADAIRDCAELGYAGTETGGRLYDWWLKERPGEIQKLLKDYNVKMACLFQSGTWTEADQRDALVADGRRWAEELVKIGGEVLMIVPGSKRAEPAYTRQEFEIMADTMNEVGRQAKKVGILCAMHPHWGTVAETREEIELLLELLDPAIVGFAPDSGQIAKGGSDPVPMFRKYANRIQHVHLKDLSPEWEEMKRAGVPLRSPAGYAEVGQGLVDFPAIFDIVKSVDFSGWLMAELDETQKTAHESAVLSREYMRKYVG